MELFINRNNFSKLTGVIFQCLVLFAINSSSWAQLSTLNDSWRWARFTTDDGLPSNRVFDIIETTSGTAWASTQSGLAWFNGYYWEPIGEQKGFPSRKLNNIVPDVNDSLLVLFDFHLYYGGKKGFRRIPIIYNGQEKKVLEAARFDNQGFLILCDSSLYIWSNGSIAPYPVPPELNGLRISGIFSTKGKALWLNTNNGLYRWDGYTWSLKLKAVSSPFAIRLFAEDEHGNGLAFIYGPMKAYGLWEWRQGTTPILNTTEGTDNIISFDLAPSREMLMVKESDEVKIRNASGWFSIVSRPPQLKNILFLKFRTDGNLWVGTENGLYFHSATAKRWTIWKYTSPDKRNSVNELLKTKDGSIWVGTGDGIQIHRLNGKVEDVRNILNKELGPVTGLEEDADGNVWVSSGSTFEGAYRWNGSRWKHFGVKDGLDAGYIHKIKKDRQGRLWFLGLSRTDYMARNVESEPGAYVYSNGHFTQWGTKQGLINGRVYSFVEDMDGSYWFGTNAGLSRWKPDNTDGSRGRWTHWTEEQGFKMGRVFTLAADSQNCIWFSDRNNGLGLITGNELRYLTTENGLVSNAVWDIRIDEQRKIWIATRGGVSIYDNGTFSSFGMAEGLENTRIWPLLPTRDKVYIGTSGGGVAILNLEHIQTAAPIIRISGPVTRETTMYAHCKAFSFWGEQSSISIEIRYKIDNKEWSPWRRQRQIIEPNLSPGTHTFTVQTKGLLGNFRTDIKSVAFAIEPPLFLEPIFFVPVGALLLSLLLFGFFYFKRKREQDKTMKKSEYRYRNLFENANDAIMIFEPKEEIILEVNKKACELYGYTRKEFIGKSLKNISKNVESGEKIIEQTLREGKNETVETVHFTKDGDYLHIIASAVVIDYEGRDAILSINRDVTELRQAEAKELLLAQTVASAKDAICITDLDNHFIFVNDAFIEMYGYSEEELHGRHISLIASPDVTEEIQKEIYKTTIGKGDWNGEVINRHKDGTLFPVELWSSVVYDTENKPVALVGVARDIAERKQAELTLREIYRSQEIIFKSVPVALYRAIPGSEFDASWISDNAFQITGFKPDRFIKEKSFWKSRIHEADLRKVTNDFNKIEAEGQISTEYRWLISDGTYRWFLDQAVIIYENEQNVKMMYGAWVDITERKLFEEEREKLIQKLKEALAEVKTLSGLLPICSSCKKIRDDKGYWGEVDSYIAKHTDATFTHGLCPDCIQKYFPEIAKKINKESSY